ncbi:MAG: antibiotic biosynthesis monooxygenase [Mucilaginibacter sp.]
MIHLLIIHQVENYTAWKQIFDDASGIRKAAGEISFQVFKYHDEPDKIVHLSIWNEKQTAAQFFNSPLLVKIRADAGVTSPEFIYLNLLESGML